MFLYKKNKQKINKVLYSGKGKPRKEKKSIVKWFIFWLVLLSFFGVVGYTLFFSGFLRINRIVIEGTVKLNNDQVRNEINAQLSGNYLNIIPKSNIIYLRMENLKIKLKEQFKIIDDVKIKREFPDTIFVAIKEKKPLLLIKNKEEEFVIDDLGMAYLKSDFDQHLINDLPTLVDTGGNYIQAKSKALETGYINFILEAKKRLRKDLDIETKNEIYTPSIVSGDIIMEAKEGWKIYFNSDIGVDKEIEILRAVLGKMFDDDKRADLEYIDLRINNKALYKFKGTEQKSEN